MVDPEGELMGQQPNPNEFDKCMKCGVLLISEKEKEMQLCVECQARGKDKEELE